MAPQIKLCPKLAARWPLSQICPNLPSDVLTLKSKGKCKHYDIKTEDNLVWLNSGRKFASIKELIYDYTENESDGIAEKLSGVCKILDPLEDPNFEVVIKEQGLARK